MPLLAACVVDGNPVGTESAHEENHRSSTSIDTNVDSRGGESARPPCYTHTQNSPRNK